MGDAEFVESRIRAFLDEAQALMFDNDKPQVGVASLIAKWTDELSPRNSTYGQIISHAELSTFLRVRGYGTDHPPEDLDAPISALLGQTLRRFACATIDYQAKNISPDILQFRIDTAVEDCVMFIRGHENPAG